MILSVDEQKFLDADDKAAKAAEKYAEHVFSLKIYEGLCKDFLAALMMELREKYPDVKMSQSELETRARATPEWREFRDAQIEQLRESGRKQISYDNRRRRWETLRSIISLKKTEISRNMD